MSAATPLNHLVQTLVHEHEGNVLHSGLDYPYIEQVAAHVARCLDANEVADTAYQPGDGTRYNLVFVPVDACNAGPQRVVDGNPWPRSALYATRGDVLVIDVGERNYVFHLANDEQAAYFSWVYVGEKLNYPAVSAMSVTLLFRVIQAMRGGEWPPDA